MAIVGSAKIAFIALALFFIIASHPAICANLPAPEEHGKDPPSVLGSESALRHLVKRGALTIVKEIDVAAVPSTPAPPHPMAVALKSTGQLLRLATLVPAKSLKLLRLLGVGLLNTSIAIPETILEKASEFSLSDLHFGHGLPATTTPPPVAPDHPAPAATTPPPVAPDHPAPARDWFSELAALKLQKKALLKKLKLLKLQKLGKVVIQKESPAVAPVGTTPIPVLPPPGTPPAPIIEEVMVLPSVPAPLTPAPEDLDDADATTPDPDLIDKLKDKLSDKLSDNEIAAPLKPTSAKPLPDAANKASKTV